MKLKTTLLLISCLFSLMLNAQQTKIAPTTSTEYLYASVGYKMQLNAKLPAKEGYTLKDYKPIEQPDRKVEFKGVFRKGETKPCAFIMIYTKLRTTPQYYGIPTANADAELWQKFFESLKDDSENQQPQLQFFAYCLANLAAQISEL